MMEKAPLAFVHAARHVSVAAGAAPAFDKIAQGRFVWIVDGLHLDSFGAHLSARLHVCKSLGNFASANVIRRFHRRRHGFGRLVFGRLSAWSIRRRSRYGRSCGSARWGR